MANLQIIRCTVIGLVSLAAGMAVSAAEPEDELKSATVLSFVRHSEWLGSPRRYDYHRGDGTSGHD